MKPKSKILIIAGSDSSGGAGIQADIKTITALGSYAMTSITAVTAQNTSGVKSIVGISPKEIFNQIIFTSKDIRPDAIKIGMLHSSNVIKSFDNFFGNYIHPHLYTSEDYRLNRIPPFSDKPLTRILASIFYNSNDSTRAMDWESKMTFNVGTDIFTMSAVLNNHYKMLKYELLSSIGFLNGSRNNTKVEKLELKKKLFSHNKGNNLYFLKGDLKSNGKFRPEKLDRMHNNLNLLSDLLNKKNITLHFLPSPNKLTAYQSQLVKPLEGRNKSVFFEKLKSLPNKRYNYVDSLEIIDTFIKNGTMDVYHFDDSHWNYIPLQSIINDIKIN